MFGWFNKEINSLDDIKGLKMRIPGVGGEVLKRAGGIPVTLPGGELFTALQTGIIDATEWVGPYNDEWDQLPSHLKAIIETAAKAVNQDILDEYTAKNNSALRELVDTHNVELRKLPDDVINEFKLIANQILEENAKKDEMVNKVYQSYKSFKKDVSEYHKVSEDAFVEARNN